MTELVPRTQVQPVSQVWDGAVWIVVAVVARVRGVPPPVEKVVEVSVMFQPAVSVPSPTSSPGAVVTVWFLPLRVSAKLNAAGVVTQPRPTATLRVVWAAELPLRLTVWPVKIWLVEVPAVSVSVTLAV